jgi:hypothetical protein
MAPMLMTRAVGFLRSSSIGLPKITEVVAKRKSPAPVARGESRAGDRVGRVLVGKSLAQWYRKRWEGAHPFDTAALTSYQYLVTLRIVGINISLKYMLVKRDLGKFWKTYRNFI